MLLGGVEHVGHPRAAQVAQVAHRLAVTDDDARADLGRYNNCIYLPEMLILRIVKLRQGSGKDRQGMALKAKGLKA